MATLTTSASYADLQTAVSALSSATESNVFRGYPPLATDDDSSLAASAADAAAACREVISLLQTTMSGGAAAAGSRTAAAPLIVSNGDVLRINAVVQTHLAALERAYRSQSHPRLSQAASSSGGDTTSAASSQAYSHIQAAHRLGSLRGFQPRRQDAG